MGGGGVAAVIVGPKVGTSRNGDGPGLVGTVPPASMESLPDGSGTPQFEKSAFGCGPNDAPGAPPSAKSIEVPEVLPIVVPLESAETPAPNEDPADPSVEPEPAAPPLGPMT